MKLSTLLLSSAALLVAGSAYAADLPAKKGAPAAKAPTGCPAFGAGFFSIPGGDTCLKIGGYMNYMGTFNGSNAGITSAQVTQAGNYGVTMDARSNSDLGVVRGFLNVENAGTSDAYVQFSGLTAGKSSALTDIAGTQGWMYGSSLGGGGSDIGAKYSLPLGSATLSIGAFNAANNNNTAANVADLPDFQVGVKVPAGAVTFQVVGATHQVTDASTDQGYAVVGKASASAGAATVSMFGGVSRGALLYTGNGVTDVADSDGANRNLSAGTNFGGELVYNTGSGSLAVAADQYTIALNGANTTVNSYGVSYIHTVAKGLVVEPELVSTTSNIAGAATTTNTVYLRIQRDF